MTEAVTPSWRARPGPVVGVCVLVYLPFALLGYGTDLDVPNVLRAGRSWVDDGVYQMSRGPGATVHELSVGVLDRVGGSVLVNLASVAFAALALWSVHVLVRRDGGRWPAWSVLVLASNPWFWIAATSLGDFVWALGLVLAGAVFASRDRRLVAGVLFGLAIGCRASSVLLVLAWFVAELIGRGRLAGPDAPRSPGRPVSRSWSASCASSRRGWRPAGRSASSRTSSTSSASACTWAAGP